MKKKSIAAVTIIATMTLSACSDEQKTANSEISLAPTTTTAPAFVAQPVEPITVTDFTKPTEDPGLHISVELQGTGYNQEGGGNFVYVLITNNNDVPLPPNALGQPTLSISGSEASRVSGGTIALDLPLGPHASTNLAFAFDTSYGSLYDATFSIGNLRFTGDLNNA
ncbi:hypothetical protein EML15_02780 [Corynebacterium sp. sy017]|uniref:hypothetical protein n=1 Tax=unclassified Corynebacterium TaxID=2624378 RepID=UPI0011849CB2|nr:MULTISPECIES: hypothetical protein [unclassified Corynebacterium]MBP3088080.1 hypothetical protein [Corynebacterium sp. sy017]QDZ43030.1 hypothetical protein FQV43_07540 [Corynebacterium sp. sy039]TSD92605.1 hypothetical protein ELY17_02780 [Corynebacterium sp. SY003]